MVAGQRNSGTSDTSAKRSNTDMAEHVSAKEGVGAGGHTTEGTPADTPASAKERASAVTPGRLSKTPSNLSAAI